MTYPKRSDDGVETIIFFLTVIPIGIVVVLAGLDRTEKWRDPTRVRHAGIFFTLCLYFLICATVELA